MVTGVRAVALLQRAERRLERRVARVGVPPARPTSSAWTFTSSPHGVAFFRCVDQPPLHVLRVQVRHEPDAHPRPGRLADDVARVLPAAGLDGVDGDRRLPPVHLPGVRPSRAAPRPAAAPPACGSAPRRRGSASMLCRSLCGQRLHLLRRCPGWRWTPSGFVSDASIRHSPITGSGTGPPHMPEWTDCFSARTSTSTTTRPRSAVVMDGSPVSKLLVSVRTMASA